MKNLIVTDPKQIQIPENATRCVVRVRHSHSVQDGDNLSRTLTTEGLMLCMDVREEYLALIHGTLQKMFGTPRFACSNAAHAMITAYLVTLAEHITRDPRLDLEASVKKSPAPAGSTYPNLHAHWKAEGLTIGQMLQRLAANLSLFGNQPVTEAIEKAKDFVLHAFKSQLVVTFDHEPAISLLAAQVGTDPNILGLEECQALIFFIDMEGVIIEVQKFAPAKTL